MDTREWKVLVVDDEFHSAEIVRQLFEDYGVEVSVVDSGEDCLDVMHNFQPHLVIMDLAMPGMDGWQTLANIKADPSIADTPVVAVTAYHSINVAQDAIRAGFQAYYPKPIDMGRFIDDMHEIIG